MNLVRWSPTRNTLSWNPFREFERLARQMDWMFEDLMPLGSAAKAGESAFSPQVDIYEKDKAYIVEVDLPGMNKEDVQVTVEGNMIRVTGERKWTREVDEGHIHRQERVYGKFYRNLMLPEHAENSKIRGTFKDGVLTIEIPKSDHNIQKVIQIT